MIKLIVFDSYGVILSGGYPPTCQALAKKYKKDWRELQSIFYTHWFNQAAERKITQQAAWANALKETGLPLSVAAVKKIHYNLMGVNQAVVKVVRELQKNYQTLMLTKNTRSQFMDIRRRFPVIERTFGRHIINTWEYGLPKASAETINFVCQRYHVQPQEILYIDDQEQNLAPAKAMGVKTVFYKSFNQFRRDLSLCLAKKAA